VQGLAGLQQTRHTLPARILETHTPKQTHKSTPPQRPPELHPDLRPPRVQGLAGLQQKGHTVPACVVDVQGHSGKGRAQGVLGHSVIIQVAWQLGAS